MVAKIRNKFGIKKVGHTGTLDPKATGVLVLCLGKATKQADTIVATEKVYECEVTLGATSTTDDVEGEIIEASEYQIPTKDEVEAVLPFFVGTFDQVPPDFSAKKVKGQRAYKAARAGKPLKLEPREVTVKELKIMDYEWPRLRLRMRCGKGFYVRSLARDIGTKLETGGYLTMLKRTQVGPFTLDQAVEIEKATEADILPI